MKVVLKQDVKGVGKAGSVADVADGFGRNFLLPRGLAEVATKGALAQVEGQKAAQARRNAKSLDESKELAARLESAPVTVRAKGGEHGKLFGAVTNAHVADALQSSFGVSVDRHKVALDEPIKTAGDHACTIKLPAGVTARITVRVVTE